MIKNLSRFKFLTRMIDINLFTIKNPKHVKILLERGHDPNVVDKKGRSPLFYNGPVEKTKLLIDHKVDINHKDKKGRTALFYKYNDPEVFEYLVKMKADVNVQDKNKKGLLFIHQDLKNIQTLILNGIDTELTDEEGFTYYEY